MAGQKPSVRDRVSTVLLTALLASALALGPAVPAGALTEPKKPVTDDGTQTGSPDDIPGIGVPMPDPLLKTDPDDPDVSEPGSEDDGTLAPEKPANVDVLRDMSQAPEPVVRMRELIIEAAASGDIERLRPLLKTSTGVTQIAIGDQPPDPITALKEQSGDPDGREILAILIDVMATGFVHVGAGTPDEAYVWPYFAEKDLNSLSPPETVELLRIVTAGDLADMKDYGGYNFYRVSINPKGEWTFFLAGD